MTFPAPPSLFRRPNLAAWTRSVAWAVAGLFLAGLSLGVAPPAEEDPLPDAVRQRFEARRGEVFFDGLLPLPGLLAAAPADAAGTPLGSAPPAPSPGCGYRGAVTSAVARLSGDPDSFLQSGLASLEAQRLEEAAYSFEQARLRDPHGPVAGAAAFWLGEARRRQGKTVEALVAFRKVEGEYADEALYRRAWLAEQDGRAEEAREDWAALAAAASPHRAEARFWLGRRAYLEARRDEARSLLRESFQALPPASDAGACAALLLALTERELGSPDEARTLLETLLLARPDHPAASFARLALGGLLLEQGSAEEAQRRFRRLLDEAPDPEGALRARYGLARAAALRDDDKALSDALAALAPAAGSGPWMAWAKAEQGMRLFDKHRYGEAHAAFSEVLSLGRFGEGEDAVRYLAAESLLRQGSLAAAVEAFVALSEKSPLRPDALRRAAQAARLARDEARAVTLYETLLTSFPAYAGRDRAWMEAGRARWALGRADEARRDFEAVAPSSPAYADALEARGRIAREKHRWDEAATLFAEFRARYPADPRVGEAALEQALALFQRGSPADAVAVLEQAERSGLSGETLQAALYHKGWMLTRAGDDTAGRDTLERLLREYPEGSYAARAYHVLGTLDLEAGRFAEALERFDAVIQLGCGGEEEESALRHRASCLFRLGQYEKALSGYMGIGDTAAGLYGKALTLHKLGRLREFSAAVEAFERNSPMDGRRGELRLLLARSLVEAGRHEEAAAQFERAAEALPEEEAEKARLLQAGELLAAGREAAAAGVWGALARGEGPSARAALRALAEWHGERGRYDQALAALDDALRKSKGAGPGKAAADAARAGWFARKGGRWDDAEARLQQAMSLAGTDAALRRKAWIDLGEVQLERGAPQAAYETLAEIDRRFPSRDAEGLRALFALARAQEALGRDEVSLETWMRIGYLYTLEFPGVAEALFEAAGRLSEAGRAEAAQGLYRKVRDEAPAPWNQRAAERLSAP